MMRPPKYLMNAKIEFEAYEGNTAYGPSYDLPVSADVYIEPTNKLTTDYEGQEVVPEYLVIVRDDINIPIKSKATYEGKEYEVINSTKYRPLNTFSHLEVYLR